MTDRPASDAASIADLANSVRRAVMLSMAFTNGKQPTLVFDHVGGSTGLYTHDDYDDAMAALNELVRRAK